jgi:hypothetical protein
MAMLSKHDGDFLPWFIHPGTGANIRENTMTDDRERNRDFSNDQEETMDLDKVSISGTHDAGHAPDHFYRATLIERIVGFMERYD